MYASRNPDDYVARWTRDMMQPGDPRRPLGGARVATVSNVRGDPSLQQPVAMPRAGGQQFKAYSSPAQPGLWSKVKGAFGRGKQLVTPESHATGGPNSSFSVEDVWVRQQQQQLAWLQQQHTAGWGNDNSNRVPVDGWASQPMMMNQRPLLQMAVDPDFWYRELEASIRHQYLLSTPVVVPAPVIVDILNQASYEEDMWTAP